MKNKEQFLDWFAGFVAGEGCFRIEKHGNKWFNCRLTILLRDDDLPILLKIQETLEMGVISRERANYISQGRAMWAVTATDDILRLIDIFDTHPLLAKKQRDYEIWKEAALEINRGQQKRRGRGRYGPATYNRRYLDHLKQKLSLIKVYEMSPIEELEIEGRQLELSFYKKEAQSEREG